MSREKTCENCLHHSACKVNSEYVPTPCRAFEDKAGYRKQREGEWIKTETNYTCSKCNFNVISWSGEYDGYERERGISLMNFCPNCGAKMKGGAE